MLQPGDELHGYRIVRLVGQGAFGAVYQAQHLLLVDDQVAIKMLLQTTADPGEWQALLGQFLDEARLLRQLSHPRLAAVTDFFEEHHSAVGFKTAFMVMNYIDGETLEMFVQRNGPVPEATVLDWTRQITSVLNYLHHELPNPVLVRDLKPQNLMLSKGRIYLLDFGIARVGGTSNPTKTILRSLGTPGFCPLEQYVGGTSPRSDYYALGATMLYLLNGATPPEATERRTHQTPLPVPSNVSVETWDAVQALMQLRQEDRPGSIQEVHHLLPLNGKAQSPASGAAPRQVHHPPPAPSPDPAQAPAGSSSGASPTARGAPWPLPTQPPTVQMVPPSSVQNPTWYPPQTPGTQSIPAPLPPVAPPYGSGTSGNPARIIVRWSLVMTLCLALVGVVFLLRTPGIYNSPPGASPSSGIATSPTSPSTVAAPPPHAEEAHHLDLHRPGDRRKEWRHPHGAT